jgi:hypothetical protein
MAESNPGKGARAVLLGSGAQAPVKGRTARFAELLVAFQDRINDGNVQSGNLILSFKGDSISIQEDKFLLSIAE